ncbi:MAG: hypothetical protein VKJ05_06230 [Synechococcaceae cyanobacterium]|nr:hypothetical protein [Synechococcaceae cyanobacterium]
MSPDSQSGAAAAPGPEPGAPVQSPSHDFDVQKEVHRRIRNDPDYDDWEYGTEPLPHEAWVKRTDADASVG